MLFSVFGEYESRFRFSIAIIIKSNLACAGTVFAAPGCSAVVR